MVKIVREQDVEGIENGQGIGASIREKQRLRTEDKIEKDNKPNQNQRAGDLRVKYPTAGECGWAL